MSKWGVLSLWTYEVFDTKEEAKAFAVDLAACCGIYGFVVEDTDDS